MNFRAEKVKKYGAFRSMMNKGLIRSFIDDSLKTEMLSMEVTSGSRQSVIQHAPGYSDDEIDSFVLSAYFFLVEDSGLEFFDYDSTDPHETIFQRWSRKKNDGYEGTRNDF